MLQRFGSRVGSAKRNWNNLHLHDQLGIDAMRGLRDCGVEEQKASWPARFQIPSAKLWRIRMHGARGDAKSAKRTGAQPGGVRNPAVFILTPERLREIAAGELAKDLILAIPEIF